MKLREVLDEVRFGNTAQLCVAIMGDYDFLDNYEEGKYWRLPAGNWEDGSESKACPAIPEEIMESEVRLLACAALPHPCLLSFLSYILLLFYLLKNMKHHVKFFLSANYIFRLSLTHQIFKKLCFILV